MARRIDQTYLAVCGKKYFVEDSEKVCRMDDFCSSCRWKRAKLCNDYHIEKKYYSWKECVRYYFKDRKEIQWLLPRLVYNSTYDVEYDMRVYYQRIYISCPDAGHQYWLDKLRSRSIASLKPDVRYNYWNWLIYQILRSDCMYEDLKTTKVMDAYCLDSTISYNELTKPDNDNNDDWATTDSETDHNMDGFALMQHLITTYDLITDRKYVRYERGKLFNNKTNDQLTRFQRLKRIIDGYGIEHSLTDENDRNIYYECNKYITNKYHLIHNGMYLKNDTFYFDEINHRWEYWD